MTMCKVLLMTGIKDSDNALEFMKAAAPEMSNGNTDGIGYSAINSKNQLFMEKWHRNHKFLRTDTIITPAVIEELKAPLEVVGKYFQVPEVKVDYMSYGEIDRSDLRTVTMHTRFATCGKSMENTHPFVDKETSLVHNGIISNSYALANNKISTCDSESALQMYLTKEVSNVATKSVYEEFLGSLTGYWAFGILAKSQDGTYMLDVIKGGAQLYFAYIPEMGDENTVVFATNEAIIKSACKTCGFNIPKIENLVDNSLFRYNALTGTLVATEKFKSARSYGSYNSYYNSRDNDGESVSFKNKFLENKGGAEGKSDKPLVTYDAKTATAETALTEQEMEYFDTMDQPLIDTITDYDLFQGSNYALYFEKLSDSIIKACEKNFKSGTLKFMDVLKVIEFYNDKKFAAAWVLVNKVSA